MRPQRASALLRRRSGVRHSGLSRSRHAAGRWGGVLGQGRRHFPTSCASGGIFVQAWQVRSEKRCRWRTCRGEIAARLRTVEEAAAEARASRALLARLRGGGVEGGGAGARRAGAHQHAKEQKDLDVLLQRVRRLLRRARARRAALARAPHQSREPQRIRRVGAAARVPRRRAALHAALPAASAGATAVTAGAKVVAIDAVAAAAGAGKLLVEPRSVARLDGAPDHRTFGSTCSATRGPHAW